MKRILVTGGAGLIGSWLVRHILKTTDWRVVVLDRLDPAGALARLSDCFEQHRDRVAMVHHDLRAEVNDGVARELFTGGHKWEHDRFDYIAHLAACSHVDRSNLTPMTSIADNVIGTASVFEFARQYVALKDDGKVLHFSTDETLGPAPDGVAFKPEDRQRPRNIYAAGKAGAEALAFSYAETFGMPITITRCTNVIAPLAHATDPGQHPEKFLPIVIERTLHEQEIQIHTVNGRVCSRYYVHVQNVCEAVMAVLERGECLSDDDVRGIYHISGDEELDNVQLCELVAGEIGSSLSFELVERPPGRLKPDLRYCLEDSSLRALGWTPTIGCRDGVRDVISSYLNRSNRK